MDVELANYEDKIRLRRGEISEDEVRDCVIDGWVDTGANHVVIPQIVADSLKLPKLNRTKVVFADGRRTERQVVGDLWLRLCEREGVFQAVVEPGREDVLIGAIVLETFDLLADPVGGTCHPRDPVMTLFEIK